MAQFTIKVTESGRLKFMNLSRDQLQGIGNRIAAAQVSRWLQGINAQGQPAKPLSKGYAAQKARFTGNPQPKRDNWLTGAMANDFTVRRAGDNKILIYPEQPANRDAAAHSEQYENMIGFAPSDERLVYSEITAAFAALAIEAWEPVNG